MTDLICLKDAYTREFVACWWNEVKNVQFAKVRPHAYSLPWWVEGD